MVSIDIMRKAAEKHPGEIMQPYDAIYELVGFDGLNDILNLLGSGEIYIPRIRWVLTRCLEKEVLAESQGPPFGQRVSIKGLARKYGYTPRHIKRLISGK